MFSTIYLPNGACLALHEPWRQVVDEAGHIKLYALDDALIGIITTAGIVHISHDRKFATYYAPGAVIPEPQAVTPPVIIAPVAMEKTPVEDKKVGTRRKTKAA